MGKIISSTSILLILVSFSLFFVSLDGKCLDAEKNTLENININEFQKNEAKQKIDEYYDDVIGELGIFYGQYKVVQYQMSKKQQQKI